MLPDFDIHLYRQILFVAHAIGTMSNLGGIMKKKLSVIGILLATLLIEFPVEGFSRTVANRPLTIEAKEGPQLVVAVNQPRRRRRRRMWRNGRWVWVSYSPSRRYRMARRYYYLGGVRRTRLVRVYY
jgi:hypothetical protein